MSQRIAVIGTGGTISTPGRHDLDLHEYGEFSRPMQVDKLLERFAALLAGYDLLPVRLCAIDSVEMDPHLWLELHRCITATVSGDPSVAGVVVTHGTSSLEETAYFLQLSLKVRVPVVLVGAQRPPHAASSDAGMNILNAVRVALAPAARDSGVLVVMNDEVLSARDVTKSANFSLHAFRVPDHGMLGSVDADGHVAMYQRPLRRHAPDTEFLLDGLDVLPPVEIVYSYVGASGQTVTALVEGGCKGIVFAGMPPGRAAPAQDVELAELRAAAS